MADADVRVVIYDSAITAFVLPGGMVYRYTRRRAEAIEVIAKANAPKRTGDLADSIEASWEDSRRDRVRWAVTAHSEHAVFVHEGTRAVITPNDADLLYVHPPWQEWSSRRVRSVSGQPSQPFLADALREVMGGL